LATLAAYAPPTMASCTPWRARRKAFGSRSFGSALSELVSELVCIVSMPRSRATSCTAKAPDEASASINNSQPSVLISSRAMRAASCGWPLESRITISICRPASPPAALIFSTSDITALRDEVPSCATRPDRIVVMPILIALSSARATIGAARIPTVEAAAPLSSVRRSKCFLRVDVIGFPPLDAPELTKRKERQRERRGYGFVQLVARCRRVSSIPSTPSIDAHRARRNKVHETD
jgi:hypothetical protein